MDFLLTSETHDTVPKERETGKSPRLRLPPQPGEHDSMKPPHKHISTHELAVIVHLLTKYDIIQHHMNRKVQNWILCAATTQACSQ